MPRLALLLTLLLVALAGCGGDDESPPETPALRDPGATETAPATGGDDGGAETDSGEADDNSADDLLYGPLGEDKSRTDADDDAGDRRDDDSGDRRDDDSDRRDDDRDRDRDRDRGGDDDDADDDDRSGGRARGDAVTEIRRAQGSLRGLVSGVARSDPGVCTRFMTLRYVERITQRSGDAAIRKCRADVASASVDTELEVFGPAEIKDDRAIIRARVRIADRRFPQVYDMRRGEDGRWRVYARLA